MKTLSQFSNNVQVALFNNILAMLGDRKALQDLLDKVRAFPRIYPSYLGFIKLINLAELKILKYEEGS